MKLKPVGKNNTILKMDGVEILFSYNVPVAARIDGMVYKTSKVHSITTTRHINQFLAGETANERPQEWFDDRVS